MRVSVAPRRTQGEDGGGAALMTHPSTYERLQIRSLLGTPAEERLWRVARGVALHLMPETPDARDRFDRAVQPAVRKNKLNLRGVIAAFDSESSLAEVVE